MIPLGMRIDDDERQSMNQERYNDFASYLVADPPRLSWWIQEAARTHRLKGWAEEDLVQETHLKVLRHVELNQEWVMDFSDNETLNDDTDHRVQRNRWWLRQVPDGDNVHHLYYYFRVAVNLVGISKWRAGRRDRANTHLEGDNEPSEQDWGVIPILGGGHLMEIRDQVIADLRNPGSRVFALCEKQSKKWARALALTLVETLEDLGAEDLDLPREGTHAYNASLDARLAKYVGEDYYHDAGCSKDALKQRRSQMRSYVERILHGLGGLYPIA